jgi:hypothetical protein
MGLDAVEIILRTEELFVNGDDEAAAVRTVGDFYNLTCMKLDVTPLESPVTSRCFRRSRRKKRSCFFLYSSTVKTLGINPELQRSM